MFTIYLKEVKSPKWAKSRFDRYYQSWDNAKAQMDKEVQEWLDDGAKLVRSIDRMNVAKGFYVYQKELEKVNASGEKLEATFALVDGYFQDE